ncbi:MAG: hypothetical protein ACMUJM_23295 [bacterium]
MLKKVNTYLFIYSIIFALIVFFTIGCGGNGKEAPIISDTNNEDTVAPDEADELLPTDETESSSLEFNISDCIGIVKIDPSKARLEKRFSIGDSTTTPIKGVNSDGTLSEITNKNIPVKDFYISNTGDLYLLLNSKFTYIDENEEEKSSILFKINPDNTYESIDNSLSSVSTSNTGFSSKIGNAVIQFDNEGAIYYSGKSGNTVLRKNLNGTITELINDNIDLKCWLVAPDGNIFIFGETKSTSTYWFRKISTTGSLHNLIASEANITFIKLFPDNKIYFGDWGKLCGVGRIASLDTKLIEPCLLGEEINQPGSRWCAPTGLLGTDNDVYALCTEAGFSTIGSDCGLISTSGTILLDYFRTYYDEIYVVVAASSGNRIWKYYPEVEFINLSLAKDIKIMKGLLSSLIIYGLTSNQQNKFILYDISSQIETDLLPDDDIEIYHMNLRSDGKIWFDGLRFSDNKYVIGYIDTSNSNEVVFLSATNLQLEDFQTF